MRAAHSTTTYCRSHVCPTNAMRWIWRLLYSPGILACTKSLTVDAMRSSTFFRPLHCTLIVQNNPWTFQNKIRALCLTILLLNSPRIGFPVLWDVPNVFFVARQTSNVVPTRASRARRTAEACFRRKTAPHPPKTVVLGCFYHAFFTQTNVEHA